MQNNIERLTARQLDAHAADLWTLSPPCQPYTRQGLKKDASDGRAASFLSILQRCAASNSFDCLLPHSMHTSMYVC